ncbi:MAG: NAD(P)H-dependent oxidoreductase subunit E [Spirochaetes bacterium]|nr:MAG: NAD(P)H-dependent oxidoreductase subunit E [Spirochaetota bacterium]
MTRVSKEKINEIIHRYELSEESILAILQDFQREFSYVPREGMEIASRVLSVPESRIFSMSTFYRSLSLVPRGRHTIKVCAGTACHLKGSGQILEALEREFQTTRNSTTKDMRFTLECVNCLGACAMAPVIQVDDDYYGHVRPTGVAQLLKKYE